MSAHDDTAEAASLLSRGAAAESFAPTGAHGFSTHKPRALPGARVCRRSAALVVDSTTSKRACVYGHRA
jgi:hypothetical protein